MPASTDNGTYSLTVTFEAGTDPAIAQVNVQNRLALATPRLPAAVTQAATTAATAWRWRVVAGALGIGVRPGAALAWCYRAHFLNAVLPGGVLGDLHRGVSHGRDAGDEQCDELTGLLTTPRAAAGDF